jgi:hypothetical protein
MKKYFTKAERSEILSELTKMQRKVLFSVVAKRYRSYFANVLAKFKGTEDWKFYLYIDHGAVQDNVKCLCGRSLRHEYILFNKKTKEKVSIGSTHFIEELNIPNDIAKDVLKGIHNIDYDIDEILSKLKNGWSLPKYVENNLSKISMPDSIEKLLSGNLPLLQGQVDLLMDKISKVNTTKGKTRNIYIIRDDSGKEMGSYEIKNDEIYQILIGKIPFSTYIKKYEDVIYRLFKKGRFYRLDDLINFLVKTEGLPFDLVYGEHALKKYFVEYFKQSNEFQVEVEFEYQIYYVKKL